MTGDPGAFAVTMAMDAFRICIGMRPKNHAPADVFRWMRIHLKQGLKP